jgi:predicted HAD superfamily hydrolase
VTIYSYDVFDTLVTRPFMRPVDVFVAVGNALFSRGYVEVDPRQYCSDRIKAEQRARAVSHPRDECCWGDIFLHFPELSYWGVPTDEAMEAELDAERRYCSPIAENVGKVNGLVESDEKVIFLSDMYLPKDFIWELICEHVVDCPKEHVFVSGELGLSKHTGHLYSYVIERYGINPSQLRHFGDNPYSDVQVPTQLGVNAVHYRGSHPTRNERLPRPRNRAPVVLSSMRGTARAARLRAIHPDKWAQVVPIATTVVAPILTAFAAWVLQDARKRGIERLYFVSRDGQILQRIASVLRQDGDPECRYLYGSRQAWFLPSVKDLDEYSLSWAWMKGMSRKGHDILRRLEITDEPVMTILAHEGFDEASLSRQFDDNELQRFKDLIITEPIASILFEKIKNRRKLLLEYLSQEGCLDGTSWAIVDIGWVLNCQRALNQVLKNADLIHAVTGYYFGVSHDHVPLNQIGIAYPFIAHTSADLRGECKADWLFRKPTRVLIDHFFVVADHESVCRYRRKEQRIVPVYVNEVNKEWRIDLAKVIHSAVRSYTEMLDTNDLLDANASNFRNRALSEMKKFCLYPRASDVHSIAHLPVNIDQTHGKDHWETLASRISVGALFLLLLEHYHSNASQNPRPLFFWLAGSAAISSWPIRVIVVSGSVLSRSIDWLRFFLKRFLKRIKAKS